MEEIINQIDKIKQMQQFPRYYLTQYFNELKAQVDTKYESYQYWFNYKSKINLESLLILIEEF